MSDRRGNIAVLFALVLPAILGVAGIAFDLGASSLKRTALQAAADNAALAGAKQLALANATDTVVKSSINSFLANQLTGDEASATNQITIDHTAGTVEVTLTESWTPFLAQFLSAGVTPIITTAKAQLQGETRVCILALNATDNQTLRLRNSAQVLAPTCGVYSNSTDAKGLDLQDSSILTAAVICSAGGVDASKSQTNVTPQTDCAAVADPLAGRAAPTFSGCDQTNLKIQVGMVTLMPGVYCGGLTITNTAVVQFQPGTYVIKDGPLSLSNNASMIGTNVGFYFTGAGAILDFNGNATVDLSGAETGVLAGMLFFADRTLPSGTTHKINAANVKNMTGTIYLPSSDLQINHNSSMLGGSAYTAIIADHFRLAMGPTLVMNTNYGATNVPVPNGVRSASQVVLSN